MSAHSPTPEKKINGFARFTKMNLSGSGRTSSPHSPLWRRHWIRTTFIQYYELLKMVQAPTMLFTNRR